MVLCFLKIPVLMQPAAKKMDATFRNGRVSPRGGLNATGGWVHFLLLTLTFQAMLSQINARLWCSHSYITVERCRHTAFVCLCPPSLELMDTPRCWQRAAFNDTGTSLSSGLSQCADTYGSWITADWTISGPPGKWNYQIGTKLHTCVVIKVKLHSFGTHAYRTKVFHKQPKEDVQSMFCFHIYNNSSSETWPPFWHL